MTVGSMLPPPQSLELPAVEFSKFIAGLEGIEAARMLALASFTAMIFDWFLTLDKEVEHFWGGPWSLSRALFLTNRYFPPCVMILVVVCFFGRNLTNEFCNTAIQTSFLMNILSLTIVQATLVLRIWFLFSHSKLARIIVVVSFATSFAVSMNFVRIAINGFHPIQLSTHIVPFLGCATAAPKDFWRVVLPSLFLHTLLYGFTTVQALQNRRLLKRSFVLQRLLRDGGFFYLFLLISVAVTSIGAFFEHVPRIYVPAVYSNFMLAATSISVSRVMLTFRSLAANLGSTEAYMLSHLELSRVAWKQGSCEGEIVIEVDYKGDDYGDMELGTVDHWNRGMPLKATRVGIDDPLFALGHPNW